MEKNIMKTQITFIVVGLMTAIVLIGGSAKADFIFGEPTNMGPIVNSSARDQGPSISGDGLELYFCSTRSGSVGGYDFWVTTRPTASDPWGEPANLGPTVNTSGPEWAPSISADGLSLYFNSPRPGGYGGIWGDIWVTTRATKEDAWTRPVNLGSTVNTSYLDITPEISADGLELFFTSNRPGGSGNQDMWVSKRGTKDDPWGTPVNLGPIVNSSANDHDASISADGRMLFFGDYQTGPFRPGGHGAGDMWFMMRPTISDPWSKPINLGPTIKLP
jgi:Tol biopolymer transport system component